MKIVKKDIVALIEEQLAIALEEGLDDNPLGEKVPQKNNCLRWPMQLSQPSSKMNLPPTLTEKAAWPEHNCTELANMPSAFMPL